VVEGDLIVFESDSDDDDGDDYDQIFTTATHLGKAELNKQLLTTLESIVNNNDRVSHLSKLSNLLLLFGNRLESNQLRNVLETIGINVTYKDYEVTADIQLELHLRVYTPLPKVFDTL